MAYDPSVNTLCHNILLVFGTNGTVQYPTCKDQFRRTVGRSLYKRTWLCHLFTDTKEAQGLVDPSLLFWGRVWWASHESHQATTLTYHLSNYSPLCTLPTILYWVLFLLKVSCEVRRFFSSRRIKLTSPFPGPSPHFSCGDEYSPTGWIQGEFTWASHWERRCQNFPCSTPPWRET